MELEHPLSTLLFIIDELEIDHLQVFQIFLGTISLLLNKYQFFSGSSEAGANLHKTFFFLCRKNKLDCLFLESVSRIV
jgi:hypothetical protein